MISILTLWDLWIINTFGRTQFRPAGSKDSSGMSRFRPTAVGDHVFLSDRFKHLIWEFMVLKYSTAQTIIYIYIERWKSLLQTLGNIWKYGGSIIFNFVEKMVYLFGDCYDMPMNSLGHLGGRWSEEMMVFWAPQVVVIVVIAYAIVQEDKPETESLITIDMKSWGLWGILL